MSDIICAFYTNETILEILGVFDFRHHSAVAVTPLLKQNILVSEIVDAVEEQSN